MPAVPASGGSHDTVAVPTPGTALTAGGVPGALAGHGVATVPSASASNVVGSASSFDMSTRPLMPLTFAPAVYCQSVAPASGVLPWYAAIHTG